MTYVPNLHPTKTRLQVRADLPRMLSVADHKRVLAMKNVDLELARPPKVNDS